MAQTKPKAPEGSPCKLYYFTDLDVQAGHYILSNGGSGYKVVRAHQVRGRRDKWILDCLRCLPANFPKGATIHKLYWFKRNKK